MSVHAPRLSRIFTPTYAAHINAQITHQKLGKPSKIVNADDLAFVMASPLKAALQVLPLEKSAAALGANISYAMVTKTPFQDCNNPTGFFVANEYIRATGRPGLVDLGKVSDVYKDVVNQAQQFSSDS